MRRRTSLRLKRAFRHARPTHIVKKRLTRSVIERYAEKIGLVYLGYVDQRDDDHRLIRGHTVSATHQDNHYCIGTVRGYDVMLALRNDVVRVRSGQEKRCHWLIYAIDLHANVEVPNFYLGHRNRDDVFAASFRPMQPLAVTSLGQYPAKFVADYAVYGSAANLLPVGQIISPQVAEVIATRFQGVSAEVEDNTLHLYTEAARPTEAQLDKMLSNGLWLAEVIDTIVAAK